MNDKRKETQQTGAQLVVRALEAQGVTHVFGIPGAKIDAVFNALVDSKIQTVVCQIGLARLIFQKRTDHVKGKRDFRSMCKQASLV